MPQQQPLRKPAWRAFWSLLCIQSINSLNEKGVQFILIALGIWLGILFPSSSWYRLLYSHR